MTTPFHQPVSDFYIRMLRHFDGTEQLSTTAIRKIAKEEGGNSNIASFISRALDEGHLVADARGLPLYGLTRVGVAFCIHMGAGVRATPKTTPAWATGTYDGAELRPFTDRAGALDTRAIKSLGAVT